MDCDEHVTALVDPATLPLDRLEADIRTWASHFAAAEARWLDLVAEFDRRKGWAGWGIQSCAHWLSWRCGIALGPAREKVRVANAIQALPRTRELFRNGTLSYSKVRAITRVVDESSEDDLLTIAQNATAAQLDRIVGAWRNLQKKDDLAAARATERKRHVTTYTDEDGSLVGRFRLPAHEAEAFRSTLREFEPPRPTAVELEAGVEPPTARQRRADALVAMATAAAGQLPVSAGERTTVVVEVDAAVLTADAPGSSSIQGGPSLAAETVRRLTCDATLAMAITDGDTTHITSGVRSIPRAIRRALARRDAGRCRFTGCETDRGCEAHHIVHRAHGGSHDLTNLVTLCRRHHHLVHEGGFSIERTPTGDLVFVRPDGIRIQSSPPPRGCANTLPDLAVAAGRTVDMHTLAAGRGERLDLHVTVWLLADKANRRREAELQRNVADVPAGMSGAPPAAA